jgi:hypothetical protein
MLASRTPGVVQSYDPDTRTCIVQIPGITDGADTGLEAEIEYPIGDKSANGTMTEIEILQGDAVWLAFERMATRAFRSSRVGVIRAKETLPSGAAGITSILN